jgi:hypothetical protein
MTQRCALLLELLGAHAPAGSLARRDQAAQALQLAVRPACQLQGPCAARGTACTATRAPLPVGACAPSARRVRVSRARGARCAGLPFCASGASAGGAGPAPARAMRTTIDWPENRKATSPYSPGAFGSGTYGVGGNSSPRRDRDRLAPMSPPQQLSLGEGAFGTPPPSAPKVSLPTTEHSWWCAARRRGQQRRRGAQPPRVARRGGRPPARRGRVAPRAPAVCRVRAAGRGGATAARARRGAAAAGTHACAPHAWLRRA